MKRIIFLVILTLGLGAELFAQKVWEGTLAVGRYGDFPPGGYYATSNTFPRNSLVNVQNLESGKVVQVIITGQLDDPSLFLVVSEEAAEVLGVGRKDTARVRLSPVFLTGASLLEGFSDLPYSTDPEINPAARAGDVNTGVEKTSPAPAAASGETKAEVTGEAEAAGERESPAITEADTSEGGSSAEDVAVLPAGSNTENQPLLPLPEDEETGLPLPEEELERSFVPLAPPPALPSISERVPASEPSGDSTMFLPGLGPVAEKIWIPPPAVSDRVPPSEITAPPTLYLPAAPSPQPVPPEPAAPPVSPAVNERAGGNPDFHLSGEMTEVDPIGTKIAPLPPNAAGKIITLEPAGFRPPPGAERTSGFADAIDSILAGIPLETARPQKPALRAGALSGPGLDPRDEIAPLPLPGESLSPAGPLPRALQPASPPPSALEFPFGREMTPDAAWAKRNLPIINSLPGRAYYLQIASYKNPESVKPVVDALGAAYPVVVLPSLEDTHIFYKVMVGPVKEDERGLILKKLRSGGYPDTFIREIN
ncbi:MAG: SPOR domain-containing protein [Spirochaetales bacterium]|nr:SPOR domain-containing protein [Spirochaetales bacterium]